MVMKTLREMMDLIEAAQQPHESNTKNPVDFPRTWHDVDPKLGKQVDKMSQAEKVKKGLAHPDTLKTQGVAEGVAGDPYAFGDDDYMDIIQGMIDDNRRNMSPSRKPRVLAATKRYIEKNGGVFDLYVFEYAYKQIVEFSRGMDESQGVAEGSEQQYLWHGSRQPIQMLEPRQSVDTGGAAGSNQNAIYATSDPKVAIAVGGLTTPDSDTAMFPNDPQMVLFSGKIRKGENVYLHKLPMNGPDGKPQFVQGAHDREFYSKPGVKGIKPVEIKTVPVNKYLNLIRQATPQDLELRKQNMKEGVAEAERQPGRFSGAWQILVNGKKVHSFKGNFDQETADRVGVVKAASRGLYNPGSGDKIKIVPVMLDQKQGVAEEQVEESSPDALSKIDELFRK